MGADRKCRYARLLGRRRASSPCRAGGIVDPAAPVTHISLYEADAFASWAGARLPTEIEWEAAAAPLHPASGQQLDDAGPVHPAVAGDGDTELQQMFGNVWEWTGSAYRPYPGFRAAPTVRSANIMASS